PRSTLDTVGTLVPAVWATRDSVGRDPAGRGGMGTDYPKAWKGPRGPRRRLGAGPDRPRTGPWGGGARPRPPAGHARVIRSAPGRTRTSRRRPCPRWRTCR